MSHNIDWATLKYSTTEQRVGTWIDGKPLYRKVFQGAISRLDFEFNIPTLGIKSVVGISGVTIAANYHVPINYTSKTQTVGVYNTNYCYWSTSQNIVCYFHYGATYEIILEYTKTTD